MASYNLPSRRGHGGPPSAVPVKSFTGGPAKYLLRSLEAGTIGTFGHDPETRAKNRQFIEQQAVAALEAGNTRLHATLTKLLIAMADHDLKLSVEADKASRLDAGESTENVTFGPIRFRGQGAGGNPEGSHGGREPD